MDSGAGTGVAQKPFQKTLDVSFRTSACAKVGSIWNLKSSLPCRLSQQEIGSLAKSKNARRKFFCHAAYGVTSAIS